MPDARSTARQTYCCFTGTSIGYGAPLGKERHSRMCRGRRVQGIGPGRGARRSLLLGFVLDRLDAGGEVVLDGAVGRVLAVLIGAVDPAVRLHTDRPLRA